MRSEHGGGGTHADTHEHTLLYCERRYLQSDTNAPCCSHGNTRVGEGSEYYNRNIQKEYQATAAIHAMPLKQNQLNMIVGTVS